MMFKRLVNTITKSIVLTEEDLELIEAYFEPVQFTMKEIIEQQGQVPGYLYFISSGYMRIFFQNEDGEEQTSYLGTEGNFMTSFLLFIRRTKTKENVAVLINNTTKIR